MNLTRGGFMEFIYGPTIIWCFISMIGLGVSVAILGYRLSKSQCPKMPTTANTICRQKKWEKKEKNWKAINDIVGWLLVGWLVIFSILMTISGAQISKGNPITSLAYDLEHAAGNIFVAGEEVSCRWVKSKNTGDSRLVLVKDFPPLKEGTIFTVRGGKFYALEYSPQESVVNDKR